MKETSAFEEFETKAHFIRRRNLLPVWIKIFVWLFLIGGALCVSFLIFGIFSNKIDLSLYGIDANHPYTVPGLIVSFLFIYKGIVAYGLGSNKNGLRKRLLLMRSSVLRSVLL